MSRKGRMRRGEQKQTLVDGCDELFAATLLDGDGAYELLQCFFRGFPVEKVFDLLRSDLPGVVEAGAYICSELGSQANELRTEYPQLLRSDSPIVRRNILEAVLCVADVHDEELVATALLLIDDPIVQVRTKVLLLLSRLKTELLEAAAKLLPERLGAPVARLARGIPEADAIAVIQGDNAIERKIAVAAAARLVDGDIRRYELTSGAALRVAAASPDSDISAFAQSQLRISDGIAADRALRTGQDQR